MDFSVWPNYEVYQQGQRAMGSLMAMKQTHAQSSRDGSLRRQKEEPLQRGERDRDRDKDREIQKERDRETD